MYKICLVSPSITKTDCNIFNSTLKDGLWSVKLQILQAGVVHGFQPTCY